MRSSKNVELTQLDRIERYSLLAAKNILTTEEAAMFLGFAPSYVYKLTMNHILPHYKPNGKAIFFDKKELEEWMTQNRIATMDEVESNAANINLRRS